MRILLLIGVLVAGCGGDDYAYKQTDPEKCKEMISVICARNVECAVMVGLLAEANATARQMTCEADFQKGTNCDGVYSATRKEDCEADVQDTPCTAWNPGLRIIPEGGMPIPETCVVEVPGPI